MLIIDKIIQINQIIKQSATNNEWDKAFNLTKKRHHLIEEIVNNNKDTEIIELILKDVSSTDEVICKLIVHYKKSSIQSNLDLRHSFKAVSEYNKNKSNV